MSQKVPITRPDERWTPVRFCERCLLIYRKGEVGKPCKGPRLTNG